MIVYNTDNVQIKSTVIKFSELILNELDKNGIYCWVAGGAVRDHFMGKNNIKSTDVDLFFKSEHDYNNAHIYFVKKGAEIMYQNENGIKIKYNEIIFDLVKLMFHSPSHCISKFDFTVSMFAVDLHCVYSGDTSFIDLSKRQLMFNTILFPASSMKRAFRYYKKGFSMCVGEMKKLVEAVRDSKPVTVSEAMTDENLSGTFFKGID